MAVQKFVLLPAGGRIALGHSGCEADADRFWQVFLDTWDRLPENVRRSLKDFWTRDGGLAVAVTSGWGGRGNRSAQCFQTGGMIQFYDGHVSKMPDGVLSYTIAHELAHADLIASGDPSHVRVFSDQGMPEDAEACEASVRSLLRAWGFDGREEVSWAATNLDY